MQNQGFTLHRPAQGFTPHRSIRGFTPSKRASLSLGFTLVEMMVSILVTVVFVLGIFSTIQFSLKASNQARLNTLETAILTENVESMQSLSPDKVPAAGSATTTIRNGMTFSVTTTVSTFDDPTDGTAASTPADPTPNDYKRVQFTVSCTSCGQIGSKTASTILGYEILPVSVAISPNSFTMATGTSYTFTATTSPSNAVGNTVTWTVNGTILGTGNTISYTAPSISPGVPIKLRATAAEGGAYGETTITISGGVPAGSFVCGSGLSYLGQVYGTVSISSQCWLAENLNVGIQLSHGTDIPSSTPVIEKWCLNDYPVNNGSGGCNTGSSAGQGGLYTWAEALGFAASCNYISCPVSPNQQGICPPLWHIPTDDEYKTLEKSLGMSQAEADAGGGLATQRGTHQEGSKLSSQTLNGNNSSGFTGLLAGYRESDPAWYGQYFHGSVDASFWTASEYSTTTAWHRHLYNDSTQVGRDHDAFNGPLKEEGYSVRCVMN